MMYKPAPAPTKEELLNNYRHHEPQFFTKYLGFSDASSTGALNPSADIPGVDKDGHVLFVGETYELSGGHGQEGKGPAIRILIQKGTANEVALALVRKVVAWMEKDGIPF